MKINGFDSSEWRARLLAYAPLFLWIALVLGLSFGEASMSETSRIIRPLLKFLFPNAPEATITAYHAFIRKSAHFTEYAILAVLLSRALRVWVEKFWRRVALTLAPAMIFAAADELHQSFVASRTASLGDVLLNCSGALFGLMICATTWKRNSTWE